MKVALGLSEDANPALVDTHRKVPKAAGGEYVDLSNVRLADPVAHMEIHGNLRERSPEFEHMKATFDDLEQVRKTHLKVNNQLLAFERRTDHGPEVTRVFLQEESDRLRFEVAKRERLAEKAVKVLAKTDTLDGRIASAALGVRGVGPVTVGYCLVYIDIEKARHASSLWAYVGLDKPSHSRYEKNVKGGGNKTLRTKLWTMADAQVKSRGAYREIYDQKKAAKEASEQIVKSRNTQGKMVEIAWKDAKPCHRHGHALRQVMKHFLADYWFVAREIYGLPTDPLYAESILGNHRTISPRERGWVW